MSLNGLDEPQLENLRGFRNLEGLSQRLYLNIYTHGSVILKVEFKKEWGLNKLSRT